MVASGDWPKDIVEGGTNHILQKLRLIKKNRIINAAVVLFGKEFLPDYPQCSLRLASFKGIDKTEFLDKMPPLHENIFVLLNEAMTFIRKNVRVAARIEDGQLERKEIPPVPFKALREAIINALTHRDYAYRRGDMQIAIFDDRIEISNKGGLPPGVSIEQIKKGEVAHERRNPIIANVLNRFGYVEQWGRGITQIIKNCKDAGDPEPEFINKNNEFKVIFRFPSERTQASTDLTSLTTRQQEIFALLLSEHNAFKTSSILEKLSDTISGNTLRRELGELKKLGLIDSRGKAQKTEWFAVARKFNLNLK